MRRSPRQGGTYRQSWLMARLSRQPSPRHSHRTLPCHPLNYIHHSSTLLHVHSGQSTYPCHGLTSTGSLPSWSGGSTDSRHTATVAVTAQALVAVPGTRPAPRRIPPHAYFTAGCVTGRQLLINGERCYLPKNQPPFKTCTSQAFQPDEAFMPSCEVPYCKKGHYRQ